MVLTAFSDHDWLIEKAFRSFGPLLKVLTNMLTVLRTLYWC